MNKLKIQKIQYYKLPTGHYVFKMEAISSTLHLKLSLQPPFILLNNLFYKNCKISKIL